MKNSSRNQEFDEVTSQERADIEEGLRSLATQRHYTMEEVYEACELAPRRARPNNAPVPTTTLCP